MNISALRSFPSSRPIRPNPADTIAKGQELGIDDTQKDLFALSAGISDIKRAQSLADFGKEQGQTSWQQGAYAVAGALAGGPALGSTVTEAVKNTVADGTLQAFLSVATAFEGPGSLEDVHRVSAGLGETTAHQGLFATAASAAGPRLASEALDVGLSEGQNSEEAGYYSMATAVAGGVRALGPLLSMAEDFASQPELNGPYALAASLAGQNSARSVLRMAESLGQTPQEKAAFSLAGGLLGVERAPGFIRMARANAENESQIPTMTVAAALTGAPTSAQRATAVAGAILYQEL